MICPCVIVDKISGIFVPTLPIGDDILSSGWQGEAGTTLSVGGIGIGDLLSLRCWGPGDANCLMVRYGRNLFFGKDF